MTCTACNLRPSTIACDRCMLDRFCDLCYRKDIVACRCPDCIRDDRDCAFCADQWYKSQKQNSTLEDKDKKLTKVCLKCFNGYCAGCVVTDEKGAIHCPQCFEMLDTAQEQASSVRTLSDVERQLEELELLGASGPHAITAEDAPVVVRRRRRQLVSERAGPELPQGNSKDKTGKPIATHVLESTVSLKQADPDAARDAARPPLPRRPDNVAADTTVVPHQSGGAAHLAMHRVDAMMLLLVQAGVYLSNKYRFPNPEGFMAALHETKSEILGSFPLEIMLGERWVDSDLDVYCTETAYERLLTYLAPEYVCTVKARRYGSMQNMEYVQHVDTWELPQIAGVQLHLGNESRARIQFIIMTDTKHVVDYLDLADITVCQNRFTGREFIVADDRTLRKQGTVRGDPTTDRVQKYWQRGFKLQITLTPQVAGLIFK